jgi:TonB family protein
MENRFGYKTKIMKSSRDKDKRKAMIISLAIYIGLAILFLFIGLKYPDPPLEESGIEISMADYGFDDTGSGELEPSTSQSSAETSAETSTENVEEVTEEIIQEEVVTQESSEISVPENSTKVNNKVPETTKTTEEEKQVEPEPEPELNENLKNVLGAWNESQNSESEGNQPGTTGNEGIEAGNVDGKGTFGGNGSSFELGGRSMIAGPKIGEKPTEEGKVVLNIWVDRQGNILRTSQNLKESTTTSQYLFNLAQNAAKKAKFNPLPSATPEQRGKMTFIFILQ